jgi:hypothetical protein
MSTSSHNAQSVRRKIAVTAHRRITSIARRCLFIDTLKVRGSDSADFHDRHVSRIREALMQAWHDGFSEAERTAHRMEVPS